MVMHASPWADVAKTGDGIVSALSSAALHHDCLLHSCHTGTVPQKLRNPSLRQFLFPSP
jgi:hypothetical protein